MEDLKALLSNPDDSSYKKALESIAELTASAGDGGALKVLAEIFEQSDGNTTAKNRIIKIAGGLEHPSAVDFIKSALNDDLFEVRRTAALSLKLLTDEDYYDHIYKSEIGHHFRRSFWCSMDFMEEGQEGGSDCGAIMKSVASLFGALSSGWTYPDLVRETFFVSGRKKPLEMASDAKVFFKNFNYGLEKSLKNSEHILKMFGSMAKVSKAETGEKEELEDILRCLKLALSTRLKDLEEGITCFLAAFHFFRMEYNIAVSPGQCQPIDEPGRELQQVNEEFRQAIASGMEKHRDFRGGDYVDIGETSRFIAVLRERIDKFTEAAKDLAAKDSIEPEGYLYLKRMGIYAFDIGKYCLLLLSCWTCEE
ncbi:MAG: HEAT repeat domain-containing protein [Firmicutes bacterium]|nr:HEAT repeat domain-containing protein [Bacillota bacterium]